MIAASVGMSGEAFEVHMQLTQSLINTKTQGKTCYEFVRHNF